VLASENIVAIATAPDGAFEFVGENGTLFLAREPLGPFVQVVRSDPNLRRVYGRGSRLIGVRRDGSIVRSSDAGRSFAPVRYDGATVFDAAVADDGRTLLLAAPEQLWLSSDGTSFARSDVIGLGSYAVGLDPSGDPVAHGIRGALVWRAGTPALAPSEHATLVSDYDLLADLRPALSGAALASGAAELDGSTWFGAIEPPKEAGRWSVAVGGSLGRASQVLPIEGTEECGRILVAASPSRVVLACLTRGKTSQSMVMPRVKLFAADRPGLVFQSRSVNLVAEETSSRIRVLPDGSVLATGMCRPGTRRICQPGPPLRLLLRRAAGNLYVDAEEPSEIPATTVQAPGTAISPDGRRLYLAARLGDPRKLALLVSDDGGKKFEPVVLDPARLSLGISHEQLDKLLDAAVPDHVGIDAEGNVSWVIATPSGMLWLLSDRDGHVGSSAFAPKDAPMISTAGRHALAHSGPEGELRASHDGGATFAQVFRLPNDFLPGVSKSSVACATQGCVVGPAFSWQGWGPAEVGARTPETPSSGAPSRRLRVPISCIVPDGAWKHIDSAESAPLSYEMDRNGTAWTVVSNDPETGRVSFSVASSSPSPRVDTIALLDPVRGESVATAISHQAEGVAVLRYPVPRDPDGEVVFDGPLRNIDVRWVDLWSPGVKRGRIPVAGSLQADDVSQDHPQRLTAVTGLLSVAADGIFVCAHATCSDRQGGMFFLDRAGRARAAWAPTWTSFPWGPDHVAVRTEWIRADGQDLPIAFFPWNTAVLRARQVSGSARFDAMTLVPKAAASAGWSARATWAFSIADPTTSIAVTVAHPEHPSAYARLLRFRGAMPGVAEVLPAPMLSEAGDPPRACTPQELRTTHRIVSPADGALRHPVRIRLDDGETEWMMTDEATVYGKAGQGCVSMMHASRDGASESALSAILDLTRPERSWLFAKEGNDVSELRWKTLHCSFDPAIRVPDRFPARPPR